VRRRVVVDRNRITGGGVTAGIDFGLRLAAELAGENVAKAIQLGLEYDPEPPFRSGHPDVAEPALVEQVRHRFAELLRQES
jgi:cyclohexyl-isocyanide hydratase